MDYNLVQRRFLKYSFRRQVDVYALALYNKAYKLIAHLDKCIISCQIFFEQVYIRVLQLIKSNHKQVN